MDYQDVLARRRMVRDYLPDPVPQDVLDRITRVVRRAPSAGFSQGHRLLLVTKEATRREIASIAAEEYYTSRGMPPWISGAPAHLVLGVCEEDYHRRYSEPDKLTEQGTEWEWPVPYWYLDAGALLMLIQLTAIDAGLASGFVTVPEQAKLRELLGMPAAIAIMGLVTLGYPAGEDQAQQALRRSRLQSRRKSLVELVRTGHWDQAPVRRPE